MNVRLIIIQKTFSIYRKGIFDRLNNNYVFRVLHSRLKKGQKEQKQPYSKYVKKFQYGRKITNVYLHILPQLLRFKPDVVIHEFTPSLLSLYILFFFRRILKYKVILWGHCLNRQFNYDLNNLSFRIRKILIKKADAIIFYSETNKVIIEEIIPSNKYFVANNSLDTTLLKAHKEEIDKIGISKIKEELKLTNTYNIVFVGRLLEEKFKVNQFIEIVRKVQQHESDIGIIIIGDGPEMDIIRSSFTEQKILNVRILGAIYDNLLVGKYLYISDLFLMPGCVGLAACHALSFMTPVVTFKQSKLGPFHGPEINYVIHNRTGYQATSFNVDEVVSFIHRYFTDKVLQEHFRINILECLEKRMQY